MRDLTADEQRAIRALERLAKTWPKSLRLVLCHGTCTLTVCDAADVDRVDDLAAAQGFQARITTLKVDSHA